MGKNLWILTEERPKKLVLAYILSLFLTEDELCSREEIRIVPLLKCNKFSFVYEVLGFKSSIVNKVLIKLVSGYSSFIDYLIFFQNEQPSEKDIPIYAIEETKTDDQESRNTGGVSASVKICFYRAVFPGHKENNALQSTCCPKGKANFYKYFWNTLINDIGRIYCWQEIRSISI